MLIDAVCRKLRTAEFSEQFRAQLNMAIRLAPQAVKVQATELLGAKKPFVRRYAQWTLTRISRIEAHVAPSEEGVRLSSYLSVSLPHRPT